jgi:hypothetical protein
MSDRLNTTTKKCQNLDSTFNVNPFQARGFGVQQKPEESVPATKAQLWENYQQAKQLNQQGANISPAPILPIQAKLTIGQPGDKYEQEADSIADRVMAMPERKLAKLNVTNSLQTRSIQPNIGNGSSPHIALKPKKKQGSSASKASVFLGMRLGTNSSGEAVVVKREVGSSKGYDDRLQAIAVARMGGADPSAIAQSYSGKWHALETTANFDSLLPSDTPTRAIECLPPLPSSTDIADLLKKIDSINEKINSIDVPKVSENSEKTTEQETYEHLAEDRRQAKQLLASLIFGVPESEIQFNLNSIGRKSGKININPVLNKDSRRKAAGKAGPENGQEDIFNPATIWAWEIDESKLDNPAEAQAVMFHEVSHLNDLELTKKWAKKYEEETHHLFVSSQQKLFHQWIDTLVPKRLSAADAELIRDQAVNANNTTEARAPIYTFLAALQAGSPDLATKQLVNYARELKPGRTYGNPAYQSKVKAALIKELQTAYKQMPKMMQLQFDDALMAAKAENPDAWISDLKVRR